LLRINYLQSLELFSVLVLFRSKSFLRQLKNADNLTKGDRISHQVRDKTGPGPTLDQAAYILRSKSSQLYTAEAEELHHQNLVFGSKKTPAERDAHRNEAEYKKALET